MLICSTILTFLQCILILAVDIIDYVKASIHEKLLTALIVMPSLLKLVVDIPVLLLVASSLRYFNRFYLEQRKADNINISSSFRKWSTFLHISIILQAIETFAVVYMRVLSIKPLEYLTQEPYQIILMKTMVFFF